MSDWRIERLRRIKFYMAAFVPWPTVVMVVLPPHSWFDVPVGLFLSSIIVFAGIKVYRREKKEYGL